ncbi:MULTISPECIES: DUF1918 domain-containing protein [unclassified Streptomyces]|uniref:DUF1918 domain-containing protein n=1 Tax=unclassified Streptomyces TaxID=2593676 RepID=UPI003D94B469
MRSSYGVPPRASSHERARSSASTTRTAAPPYDVRWEDTDRVTLYFPGPDAYIKHLAQARARDGHGS